MNALRNSLPCRTAGGVFFCLICLPALLLLRCGESGSAPGLYVPAVTFSGTLNEMHIYLPGTIIHPNTCIVDDSILKMDFFSEDYNPSSVPTGRHLKLWVYPPRSVDSNRVQITTNRIMAHVTSYEDRGTCTWEITRADSGSASNKASMTIEQYTPDRGASLHFYDVALQSSVLGMVNCPLGGLRVTEGIIEGSIQ